MEKSCGAVVFRLDEGRRLYLLLHYEEGHWDFPKGHVEENEDEQQTARREIAEETGITALELDPGFRETILYAFSRKGENIPKEVVFFLAKADGKEVKLSDEHIGFVWLPFESAERKITYKNAKEMLRKAERHLSLAQKAEE